MSERNDGTAANLPYAVLGSGDLVSHLLRRNVDVGKEYHFNVFRMEPDEKVTHSLRPRDLRAIVKLCQVLAFTIADDGWLADDLRSELFELADDLDYITYQWSNADHAPSSKS